MKSDPQTPDAHELAALYVAGAMSEEEALAFERRIGDGDAQCVAELEALSGVGRALSDGIRRPAPARVREALLRRVQRTAGASESAGTQVWKQWESDVNVGGFIIHRGGETTAWESTDIEGIEVRRLFVDKPRNQMTMLVRMRPGTSYPKHIHDGPEECYVLAGDLHVGGEVLHAGDYQRAAPGSLHGIQSTQGGCLLFIVSSLSDEIV